MKTCKETARIHADDSSQLAGESIGNRSKTTAGRRLVTHWSNIFTVFYISSATLSPEARARAPPAAAEPARMPLQSRSGAPQGRWVRRPGCEPGDLPRRAREVHGCPARQPQRRHDDQRNASGAERAGQRSRRVSRRGPLKERLSQRSTCLSPRPWQCATCSSCRRCRKACRPR